MDSFYILAERRIQQAISEGEFDNLPGTGKPLPPDRFAGLDPEMRMAARVLANSGCAPPEVGLLRELSEARARLTAAAAAEKVRLLREYSEAELRYNLAMERRRR